MNQIINLITKDWKDGKDIGTFIIRFIFGFLLIYGHGWDKLNVILSGQEIQFLDPIGIGMHLSFFLAMFAETICALLIIFGLCTRMAAIILSINFIVIFIFHAFTVGDSFAVLEPRYFYLFAFVALIFTGGGKFSLDKMVFKN